MNAEYILQVEDCGKLVQDSSGAISILEHIDFAVPRGQTVAIVGASGSGKSTLLSLMAGLDTPSEGRVWLAGADLFAMDEDRRAAHRALHVGFVFQSFHLLPYMSALENVMLALELSPRVELARSAHAVAQRMLERVGLGDRLHQRPTVLSGGEQQRVALARAFATQPDVLMADEPTGSLDFSTGERVMDLMMALNREQGTTLLLVTHDDALARRCQRQIRLSAGRIVEDRLADPGVMA